MAKRYVLLFLILLVLLPAGVLRAEVTLPRLLGDHMVVQRGLPVHVWGLASPGETVSVQFRGATRSTSRYLFPANETPPARAHGANAGGLLFE